MIRKKSKDKCIYCGKSASLKENIASQAAYFCFGCYEANGGNLSKVDLSNPCKQKTKISKKKSRKSMDGQSDGNGKSNADNPKKGGVYYCPECNEPLGTGDEYDLMRAHLWSCSGEKAKRARRAREKEAESGRCDWNSNSVGESTEFECQECGKYFKHKLGKSYREIACPKCHSIDVYPISYFGRTRVNPKKVMKCPICGYKLPAWMPMSKMEEHMLHKHPKAKGWFTNPLWKKGNWQISVKTGRICVENVSTGRADWPIMYQDGSLGWDKPEIVPQYVKEAVFRVFHGGISNYESNQIPYPFVPAPTKPEPSADEDEDWDENPQLRGTFSEESALVGISRHWNEMAEGRKKNLLKKCKFSTHAIPRIVGLKWYSIPIRNREKIARYFYRENPASFLHPFRAEELAKIYQTYGVGSYAYFDPRKGMWQVAIGMPTSKESLFEGLKVFPPATRDVSEMLTRAEKTIFRNNPCGMSEWEEGSLKSLKSVRSLDKLINDLSIYEVGFNHKWKNWIIKTCGIGEVHIYNSKTGSIVETLSHNRMSKKSLKNMLQLIDKLQPKGTSDWFKKMDVKGDKKENPLSKTSIKKIEAIKERAYRLAQRDKFPTRQDFDDYVLREIYREMYSPNPFRCCMCSKKGKYPVEGRLYCSEHFHKLTHERRIENPSNKDVKKAIEKYVEFHSYNPEEIKEVDFPDPKVLTKIGTFSAVGYNSKKWTGKPQKYIHQLESNKSGRGTCAYDPQSKNLICWTPVKVKQEGITDIEDE